jgi:hypothetical protein
MRQEGMVAGRVVVSSYGGNDFAFVCPSSAGQCGSRSTGNCKFNPLHTLFTLNTKARLNRNTQSHTTITPGRSTAEASSPPVR